MGAGAGLQPGDRLISVGDVQVSSSDFGLEYRRRYANEPEGTPITFVIERGGQRMTLEGKLQRLARAVRRFQFDGGANPKAVKIRESMLGK
jgi:S1-C subfamily serine protease